MAKKQEQTAAPKRDATCVECGRVGQAGIVVMPYSFAKGDLRWLCSIFEGQCMATAWNRFKGAA